MVNRRGFLASLLVAVGAWFAPKTKDLPVVEFPSILNRSILAEAQRVNEMMDEVLGSISLIHQSSIAVEQARTQMMARADALVEM